MYALHAPLATLAFAIRRLATLSRCGRYSRIFLLLTVEWVATAFVFGFGSIAAMVQWVWQLDRKAPQPWAEIGEGVRVPVQPVTRRSHSWWATLLLAIMDCTIFASFIYSHVHLSMALDVCPPPGASLANPWWSYENIAFMLISSAWMFVNTRRGLELGSQTALRVFTVLALLLMGAAFALALRGQVDANLSPTVDGWSASVAILLAYQGFHTLLLLILGTYLIARSWAGLLVPEARATLDNVALLWHAATFQVIVTEITLRAVPAWMNS